MLRTRFDVVLALMGVALAGGVAVGLVSGLSVRLTTVVGSILASVGLLDGLVVNPPRE